MKTEIEKQVDGWHESFRNHRGGMRTVSNHNSNNVFAIDDGAAQLLKLRCIMKEQGNDLMAERLDEQYEKMVKASALLCEASELLQTCMADELIGLIEDDLK